MRPFKLTPHYADYLWGGERLRTQFGKETDVTPLAESWELSCHPDGPAVIAAGPCAGTTLPELLESGDRTALLGRNCAWCDDFPLLIKLIDAKQALSIQVHPDDGYARRTEGSWGKTEMWYVLDAAPDSYVYYGVRRPVTKDELRAAIAENRLEELLDRRPARRGDVIFIPAGTIHAIGAGLLVCEVQQNSNITYRVYDFGRRGADSKPRALHVDQALEVANLSPVERDFAPQGEERRAAWGSSTLLVSCDYFQTQLVRIEGVLALDTDGSAFHSWMCIDGEGALSCQGETIPLRRGDSVFVPADAGDYTVGGGCVCVLTAPAGGPSKPGSAGGSARI